MSNLVSQILQAEALQRAVQYLRNYEQALESHLKSDYEAVKADLEARIAHFKAEVARLEGLVGARVAELVRNGNGAQQAVHQATAEAVPPVEAPAAEVKAQP